MTVLAGLLKTVPEGAVARVTAVGDITHECPHVDETDYGTVAVSWTCDGSTVELHSLAAYLDAFDEAPISHEAITEQIRVDLSSLSGVRDVTVVSQWQTADLEVRVQAGG